MKFFILLVCFWLADHFTKASRSPANCGVGSPFTLVSYNDDEQEEVWSTRYKGMMYAAHFDRSSTKIVWRIDQLNKTAQTVLKQQDCRTPSRTCEKKWTTHEEVFDEFKFKVWENSENERPYTAVYILNSDKIVLPMNVSFAAFSSLPKFCTIMNVTFTECRTEPPLMVVTSSSSDYQSEGKFTCEEGFDLISSNPITSTKSVCLASALWNNSNSFNCYTAPNDTHIVGNLMIKENEKMEIYCKFTQTTPHADKVKFSFHGETKNLPVGHAYIKTITIDDDGKEMWCQPVPGYTALERFSDKGKSPARQLRVLFSPRYEANQLNNVAQSYNWNIGTQNSCNFTFVSRPLADTIDLYSVHDSQNTRKLVSVGMEYVNSSHGDLQTITITDIQNDQLKSQEFQLQIRSSEFPDEIFNMTFDLNVIKIESPTEPLATNQISIYVGVGVAIVIIFLVVLLLVVLYKRRKISGNRKQSVLDGEDHVNVIYNADEEREEKINPIYGVEENSVSVPGSSNVITNPHATTIDASCNEYELEDVILDDIYARATDDTYDNDERQTVQGGVTNQPQGEYAEVDKTKSNKFHLQYDDSETYAEVT